MYWSSIIFVTSKEGGLPIYEYLRCWDIIVTRTCNALTRNRHSLIGDGTMLVVHKEPTSYTTCHTYLFELYFCFWVRTQTFPLYDHFCLVLLLNVYEWGSWYQTSGSSTSVSRIISIFRLHQFFFSCKIFYFTHWNFCHNY